MADQHDENPPGRLLFTDFDASDKGRPVAALGDLAPPAGAPERGATGILSLEQLASTLDLDFEDDAEPARPAPGFATDAVDAPETQEQRAAVSQPDAPAADFSMPSLGDDQWLYENGSFPTWEQFANSFSGPAAQQDSPLATFPEPPKNAASYPANEAQARNEDYTQYPTDAYPMVEDEGYDGYDGFDDLLTEAGEDVDIMSIIPPAPIGPDEDDEQVHRPFEGKYRGHRLGVKPPRRNAYGGIKRLTEWFRPPEPGKEAEQDHSVQPMENWYEPPEDYLPGDRLPSRRDDRQTDILDNRRTGVRDEDSTDIDGIFDEGPAVQDGETDIIYKSGPDETSTTRNFDVFDSMDLDAAWKEKTTKASSRTSARFRSATRDQDVFSNLDIDAIWESKNASKDDASDTIILNKDQLDNSSTVILAEDDLEQRYQEHVQSFEELHEPAETAPASQWEDVWRETHHAGVDNPELIEAHNALGFLDDLDGIAAENPPQASTAQAKKAGKAKNKTQAEPVPETDEEFNLDALIADTDTAVSEVRDVEAPAIDDTHIQTDTRRIERQIQGMTDVEEPEDPFAMPARAKGGGSVTPPTVSDDDLETPSTEAAGEKSGTREMRALFGDRNAGDEGEEGEAGEAEAEEDAAVNPLDVFANMDGMDFADDGLDDEMRAMLEDDESEQSESELEAPPAVVEPMPADLKGKIFYYVRKIRRAVFSRGLLSRILTMIAWKENWWFYCDLAAALITSASLAVIISYYIWYQ